MTENDVILQECRQADAIAKGIRPHENAMSHFFEAWRNRPQANPIDREIRSRAKRQKKHPRWLRRQIHKASLRQPK